jgi:zinc transport system ATP-binding protein
MNPDVVLEAKGLGFSAGGRSILDRVSLQLHDEEILTVIGPNGAGKTSLMRVLIGLAEPDQGSVWRRPGIRIGYMPQSVQINPSLPMSVKRFLCLSERNPRKVLPIAEETGVSNLLEQPLIGVSGGEFQRILLARALLRNPQLLVLDEPVQGVDVNGQVELYALINSVRARHRCAVLMISHDLHLVMAATDTVLCLNRHVCCAGKPEHVSADPAFLQLFGHRAGEAIAVYTHHHDHEHDLHGEVVDPAHPACAGTDHHHG